MPFPHVTFNSQSGRAFKRSGERYHVSTNTQFPASEPPYHLCEPSAAYPPPSSPASYNAPPSNPHRPSDSQSYRVHGDVTLNPHADNGLPFDLGQLCIDPARASPECRDSTAPEGSVSSTAYASSRGRASSPNRRYESGSHNSHASSLRDPYTFNLPSREYGEVSRRSGPSEYSTPSSRSSRPQYSHSYAAPARSSDNGPVRPLGRTFDAGVAVGGYTADQASWVSSSSGRGGGGRESHREGSHGSSRRSRRDEEYY